MIVNPVKDQSYSVRLVATYKYHPLIKSEVDFDFKASDTGFNTTLVAPTFGISVTYY